MQIRGYQRGSERFPLPSSFASFLGRSRAAGPIVTRYLRDALRFSSPRIEGIEEEVFARNRCERTWGHVASPRYIYIYIDDRCNYDNMYYRILARVRVYLDRRFDYRSDG